MSSPYDKTRKSPMQVLLMSGGRLLVADSVFGFYDYELGEDGQYRCSLSYQVRPNYLRDIQGELAIQYNAAWQDLDLQGEPLLGVFTQAWLDKALAGYKGDE